MFLLAVVFTEVFTLALLAAWFLVVWAERVALKSANERLEALDGAEVVIIDLYRES